MRAQRRLLMSIPQPVRKDAMMKGGLFFTVKSLRPPFARRACNHDTKGR
jgi:hypothetical protein